MVDIDKFKMLNDTHGHATGDEVLRAVAGAIVSAVREDDVPARFGGEEFVVLLRNPDPGVAVEVGERIRAAVRGLDLRRSGSPGSACRSVSPSRMGRTNRSRSSSRPPTRRSTARSAAAGTGSSPPDRLPSRA